MTSPEQPTCPVCAEQTDATDQFCEGCGCPLAPEPEDATQHAVRASTRDAVRTQRCAGCGHPPPEGGLGEAYCPECGLRHDDGTDRVRIVLPGAGGISDRGLVHVRNEDALALGRRTTPDGATEALAAVVCDGVSSVENPQLASRAATDGALTVLLDERGPDTDSETLLRHAVDAAAKDLTALPQNPGRGAPSCTLVAALVELGPPVAVTVAWVGDSRAYWLARPDAAAPSQVLTTDHSWAVEIVAIGELDEAAAAADPRAHAITRWMGADSSDEPSIVTFAPTGPGIVLLCSDGLWNYLPDAAALASAAFAAGPDPVTVAEELTAYALDCGGRDNITVVAIPVDPARPVDPAPADAIEPVDAPVEDAS